MPAHAPENRADEPPHGHISRLFLAGSHRGERLIRIAHGARLEPDVR
jgi:hypothetical protein